MPRPVWTGSISFGMVSIPVRLVPAVRRKSVSFNQLDSDTMSRIRYRKVSDATGEEVPADRIVKAAEVEKDRYVVITEDDLAGLSPAKSRELELEAFVPAADLDPVMFDSSYFVVPDKAPKPYALLAQAMAGDDRVAVGRFVMRQKEYLAAVRSDGERLMLSTLVFPDELVDAGSVEEFAQLDGVEPSSKELDMARSLVEALSDEFRPEAYVDEYRAAVERLIEEKAAGEEPTTATPSPEKATVIDLAAALEASLAQAQEAKNRHPSTGGAKKAGAKKAGAKKAGANKAAAKKAPAKKVPARKATAKKAPAKKVPARKSA